MRRPFRASAACLCLALTVGCASVDTQPFQTFAQNAQDLQTGAGRALEASPAAARERFITTAVAAEDLDVLEQLRLDFDPARPFTWDGAEVPLFLQAERFRVGVQRVAGVFTQYAQLLLMLASPALLPTETFDQLTTDLNANAFDAVTAIRGEPAGGERAVGLISTAAIGILKQYLESKRRNHLVEALTSNQSVVENYADELVEAMRLAATHAWSEYDLESQAGIDEFLDAEEDDRRAIVERLIELEGDQLTRIEVLGALRDSFSALPAAHMALIEAANDSKTGVEGINAAMAGAKRLEALFDRSVLANQATAARGLADEAAVRASIAQARADTATTTAATARAEADRARAEADRARAEAEADPDDAAKQATAAELENAAEQAEEVAEQAEEVAERLTTAAGEAQAIAEAAKKVADEAAAAAGQEGQEDQEEGIS